MIIACERCKTRFNVPDDKLVGGPVRMRCSKCDHTFVATPAAALPATSTQSLTPVGRAPTPAPVFTAPRAPSRPDPFASPPGRPTESFGALGAPPPVAPVTAPTPPVLATSPFPFAAVQPPAAAPSLTPAPVTMPLGSAPRPAGPAAPFATLSPPPPPDPFAALAPPKASDPFAAAPTGSPGAPPSAADPFAALTPSPSRAPDPFAALAAPPSAPADPFAPPPPPAPSALNAAPSSPPDPFAALTPAKPADPFATPAAPDPFAALAGPSRSADPFAMPSTSPPVAAPFAAPPTSDPFAPPPPPRGPDPFAAPSAGGPDPFAAPLPRAGTPGSRSGFGAMPTSDPFAMAPSPPSPAPFGAPSAGLAGPDPFADLDVPSGPMVDDEARAALFGITAPPAPPPPTTPPAPPPSGLELATPTPTPAAPPPPAPHRRVPARLIEAVAGGLQAVLIVGVTLLAIVVGRSGSVAGLLALDPVAALALPAPDGDTGLIVDDVVVARRLSASGLPLLVITGVVHHRGDRAFPGVVVEADLDGTLARGHAWTAVGGERLERVATAEDIQVLQALRSSSPTVSPGDRAPFVIVVAAPEGVARPRLTAKPAS